MHVNMMNAKLDQLAGTLTQVTSIHRTLTAPPNSLVSCPDMFSGDTALCKGFLLQCSLYFTNQDDLSE